MVIMMDDKIMLPAASDVRRVLRLDVQEIPSFPPVMARLIEMTGDEKGSMAELSKIVQTDPGISARVLRLVNSALYGLTRKITDVDQAVVYIGFDEVKRLAMSVAVFDTMTRAGKQVSFDRLFFWRHCLCVAVLSMALAEEIKLPDPGEAYVSGLLHDLGKIVFDLRGRVHYGDFMATLATSSGPMITEERAIMGMGHDDLGAYYSSLWGLPEPLTLAMKYHHRRYAHAPLSERESRLVSIVALADFLSWTQGMGSVDIARLPVLQPEIEKIIDLGGMDLNRIIRRMDMEMERTSEFYHFAFPSASQYRENLLRANLKLCSINTRYYYEDTRDGIPDISRIKESITAPHSSLDPREIISATLKAIHKDLGFQRLYVMRILKDTRCLKVVDHLDVSESEISLKSMEIPLDREAGGFLKCLRNHRPLIITGRTEGEKKALAQFGTMEMIIVPFHTRNKVIGVLGLDCGPLEKPLQPDMLSAVAMVANELGTAMDHAGAYREARAVSLRDGLTGLLNRSAVDDLLDLAFQKASAGEQSLSVVMLDVDFFKKFNDRFGHQSGDNILKLIADTMKKMSRPFDHVGRYGGEEFIVVLNDTSLPRAYTYAERIRREIERLGKLLAHRFPGLSLTVSAGVSEYDQGVKNREILIAKADKALYQAKETGRNKVVTG